MPSGLRGRERVVEILSSRLGSAAILRAPMVRDANGDLRVAANSIHDEALMPASSPFQITVREGALRMRMDRGSASRRSVAHDHTTRPLGEIDAARIQAVPKDHPGADWHLMLNQAVTLPSGTTIRKAFFFGRDVSAPLSRAAPHESTGQPPTAGTIQLHEVVRPGPQPAQFPRAICACQLDESADRRRRLHKAGKLCKHFGVRTLDVLGEGLVVRHGHDRHAQKQLE